MQWKYLSGNNNSNSNNWTADTSPMIKNIKDERKSFVKNEASEQKIVEGWNKFSDFFVLVSSS